MWRLDRESLRREIDEQRDLIHEMQERVEGSNRIIESWIEAFEMEPGGNGVWEWKRSFVEGAEWAEKYSDLVREWNRFVGEYNSVIRPRNVGRPLAASEAQVEQVRRLHKRGMSLRAIVDETSLSLRTVRTIVEQAEGCDRTTLRHLKRIDPDRRRLTAWRARKRTRDALPRRINETLAEGRELVKRAKGLGR
jgi:hypothetical protein